MSEERRQQTAEQTAEQTPALPALPALLVRGLWRAATRSSFSTVRIEKTLCSITVRTMAGTSMLLLLIILSGRLIPLFYAKNEKPFSFSQFLSRLTLDRYASPQTSRCVRVADLCALLLSSLSVPLSAAVRALAAALLLRSCEDPLLTLSLLSLSLSVGMSAAASEAFYAREKARVAEAATSLKVLQSASIELTTAQAELAPMCAAYEAAKEAANQLGETMYNQQAHVCTLERNLADAAAVYAGYSGVAPFNPQQ
jgi:hypothetical protein